MPSRFRAWLRVNLWRGHGTTTETAETDTRIAPPSPSSTLPQPPPPYETCIFQPGLRQGTTAPPAVAPPPSSDQATLPFLQANLRREDETRILQVLGHVLQHARAGLARRGDDGKTIAAIADAVREGAIAAAVTVRKTFIETTSDKLNDDVDEGCRKVANAVIAATAAAPVASMMGTASGAADCIYIAAQLAAYNKKDGLIPYAVATQLGFTAQGVVAAISARIINGNLCLSDIPLPSRSKILLKT